MPNDQFTERILRFVGKGGYQPQELRSLAHSMGVAEEQYGDFHHAVKALTKAGRIVLGSANVLMLPEPANSIVGHFRLNPKGFGFVIPESPNARGDLYVPPGKSGGAVTGDTVQARVLKRGKRGDKMIYEGKIERVIARGHNQLVGELFKDFGRWFVRPDGRVIHGPVFVDDPSAKSARPGDQVVIEITRYPEPGREAQGVIVRLLGKRGEPEVDTLSMIIQYQLPEEFPKEALQAAHDAAAGYDPEAAAKEREDLRKLEIITIDPDDARDFDDAISLTPVKGGGFELGVHIADVSHFVSLDGTLDREARERSTSVYFPRFVIPMLPETLSNGVCSLQEQQDRLAKSAFITYDGQGRVLRTRFANSIIRSMRRLTYRQATAILEGSGGRTSKKVHALVKRMETLAKVIRKRRIAEGMLVLDLPDVELVFDEKDNVIGVEPEDTSFSHTIIEMFMVEANEAVARLFRGLDVPAIRRIHPEPDHAASESLGKFLAAVGLKTPTVMDRFAMQDILRKVKNKPESFAVNLALLRSLQQAEYAPTLVGHFALASSDYLHFTSPIRRYPDLTAHRLLDAYVRGKLNTKKDVASVPGYPELEELGAHCSRTERRAEDAERELKLVKILRLLEQHVGDVMSGIVTGVTNFGIYIQLQTYLVDGLLRFDELPDDWWEVDTERGCVVAQRSGQRIRIGQKIEVMIMKVDIAARQLDLTTHPADNGKSRGKSKVRKSTGRKKGKQSRGKPAPRKRGKNRRR